jgi:hypothetical protein
VRSFETFNLLFIKNDAQSKDYGWKTLKAANKKQQSYEVLHESKERLGTTDGRVCQGRKV